MNWSTSQTFFQPLGQVLQLTQVSTSAVDASGGRTIIFANGKWVIAYADDEVVKLALVDRQDQLQRLTVTLGAAPRGLAVSYSGSEYGVTWCDAVAMPGYSRCEATFARANASGEIVGSRVRLGQQFSRFAGVEWTGTEWLTTWNDATSGNFGLVFTTRISASGAEVAGARRQISCGGNDGFPVLTWDGARAIVSFTHLPPSFLYREREVLFLP